MDRKNNDVDWGGWLLTIIMLGVFWPVGLILLFRQLMGYSKPTSQVKKHPYDIAKAEAAQAQNQAGRAAGQPTAGTRQGSASRKEKKQKADSSPVNVSKGNVLMIVGAAIAGVFGIGMLATIADYWGLWSIMLSDLIPITGFFCGGLVCLHVGRQQRKRAKRYKKYLAYIGKNREISLHTLAAAMGEREKTVYNDLQDMLDAGVLPMGYIDLASGKLVLSDEGISEPQPEPEPEVSPFKDAEEENAILQEIRDVDDAIPDEVMSAKIARIGEITGKILDFQRRNPSKSSELRSFLNYYLPTTLKVLRAYAQLDAQGIEGENINAAKARIEGMMDQVVAGFEKQLDRLFQDDMMDITSDVAVLENMLKKDGLDGSELRPGNDVGQGMTLGG